MMTLRCDVIFFLATIFTIKARSSIISTSERRKEADEQEEAQRRKEADELRLHDYRWIIVDVIVTMNGTLFCF